MQILEKYKGKKLAILGYGLEGQATHNYLSSHGVSADVLDEKNSSDYLQKLIDYDIVFRTPGISPLRPELVAASRAGVVFTSQLETFFEGCAGKIIGITGTKGKGTTSTLIYDILKAEGFDVFLGGNIGVPAISFLDEVKAESWVVLELSSFQLQTLEQSPYMAVVLNITSEHLDYHQDTAEYRKAKSNIVSHQSTSDYAIMNDDYDVSRDFAKLTPANKYFFSKEHKVPGCYVDTKDQIILDVEGENLLIAKAEELKLRGRHNLENVAAAVCASYLAGVKTQTISAVIRNFQGLEHRLELVREVAGVRYYNDSFSTVPETAIAALNSFTEPIVLIAGGSDKKSDYRELGQKIVSSQVKAIILMGDMAETIRAAIPATFQGETIMGISKMNEAVNRAASMTESGDVVLLSPACASFGLFENYKDRGNQFKESVNNL